MQKRGLILVVNFNQAHEIGAYLTDCLRFHKQDQILVVDDGSSDGSDNIAEKMGFKLIRHSSNRGIGAAIRTGIMAAIDLGYEWILISSSNGKMIPAEFAGVYGAVDRGEVEFVQGSRYLKVESIQGLTRFRRLAIPAFTMAVNLILNVRLTDVTCGLRCYRLDLCRNSALDLNQTWLDRYELEYYLLYKFVRVMKVKWIEVPVTIRYSHLQKGRKSKIVPITGWWSMIRPFVFLRLGLRR